MGQSFNEFVHSLGEVLIDITALEVNTMVVAQITGEKFIAWQAYRDLYPISKQYLENNNVHESLHERYLDLRKNLELEYTLIVSDPSSEFYEPKVLNRAGEDNHILTDPEVELDQIQTLLPDPFHPTNSDEILKAKAILSNGRFLRSLRKLSELKSALDNRNKALHKKQDEQIGNVDLEVIQKAVKTDIIYAQTVVQLDGDVINRYSQEIFDHPHRDMILEIHRSGVSAGEKQWRGLLQFIIGLVQASLRQPFVQNVLPWNSSKN
ncbi:MAG: hypothetical protein F6K36_02525 [Symploca sp. SIO3C6]|uniref:Uncharacterized protein n=1 Tax=Symploca sp. SIO1C4 TaxID=2607765 RepID=A0A6B3NM35_9CYAN|nr:hypothetical protein [Symploca sp. SIO3C6]NER31274.1 hypothetical protein [Symploca sp. SIO1C4]NET05650.1 hypothetical protein [Symploca sp. SIO2B6]